MNSLEALISCLYKESARGPLQNNRNADAIIVKLFDIVKGSHPREMQEAFDFGLKHTEDDPAMVTAIDEVLDDMLCDELIDDEGPDRCSLIAGHTGDHAA